jgi:hypothetical protein
LAGCLALFGFLLLPGSVAAGTSLVTSPGYTVSVFAQGTSSYLHPDSIDVTENYVFVGYQNITAKDGTDNKTSTIVQYTLDGKVVDTFSVLGHCDGLRFNQETGLLWATSNEDGNPRIVTIDPVSGTITPYTFPTTPHGGGYDDVIFVGGKAFIAASNPNLNSAGVNVFPALDEITLSNGQATLTPVLQGNATATDEVTGKPVTLNLTDPDSLSIDNHGNLVLDSQGDGVLVTVHKPGTPAQSVTVLSLSDQVDDSLWTSGPGKGALLVVDSPQNVIYKVTNEDAFHPGTIFTEAPSDSLPTPSIVGTIDPRSGQITPIITGLGSPTGLAFLPAKP